MLTYRDYVFVFLITACFDMALNLLPAPIGAVLLRDYFSQHTVLGAALLAGFIGAFTLPVIELFTRIDRPTNSALMIVFLVSGLIGFPMEWSGIFPHLNTYYYEKLPRYQSFLADGLSGVMVACVYWIVTGKIDKGIMTQLLVLWVCILIGYLVSVQNGFIISE